MFEVRADSSRRGLPMRWNDSKVQAEANTMANGELGLETSGAEGVFPGAYESAPIANVNSRSWGDFTSSGKGNRNYLDTYVWLHSSMSSNISLSAVDGVSDSDGDGLSDFEESCFYGTEVENPDSDGNGVPDGEQYGGDASSGSVGGLESNGRLSEQLARRAISRTRVATRYDRFMVTDSTAPLLDFAEMVQNLPLEGARVVDATPSDLPVLTNATGVYAHDFVDKSNRVVASILAVETIGETYEHSKACLLYTSPSPRDQRGSRMPSSA